MARINLTHHYMFLQLARALGSRPLARGILELLWEAAYEHADPYIGTPEDIAEAVGWTGPPMELVDLLISCGFLDDVGAQYVVHDLWKNAPDFVRLRWLRAHPHETKKNRPWNAKPTSGVGKAPTGRRQDPLLPAPPPPAPLRTERAAASPLESIDVLARLGHELHDEAFTTEADLKEALKTLAAQYAIPYDGYSINAALDRLTHSRRPVLIERAALGARERKARI